LLTSRGSSQASHTLKARHAANSSSIACNQCAASGRDRTSLYELGGAQCMTVRQSSCSCCMEMVVRTDIVLPNSCRPSPQNFYLSQRAPVCIQPLWSCITAGESSSLSSSMEVDCAGDGTFFTGSAGTVCDSVTCLIPQQTSQSATAFPYHCPERQDVSQSLSALQTQVAWVTL
jgi:hypothetical protein